MARATYAVTPDGLAVPVLIGLDGGTTAARHATGQPIPAPIRARGLLDTCSDVTAVAASVLQQLAILPTHTAKTTTAAGPVSVRLFQVSLSILGPPPSGGFVHTEPALLVSELPTVLPDADVLIGLDVLLKGRLLLEGPPGLFTLDF
jgi:hypothetical protein